MEQSEKKSSFEIWHQKKLYDLIGKLDDKTISSQLYLTFYHMIKTLKEKDAQL